MVKLSFDDLINTITLLVPSANVSFVASCLHNMMLCFEPVDPQARDVIVPPAREERRMIRLIPGPYDPQIPTLWSNLPERPLGARVNIRLACELNLDELNKLIFSKHRFNRCTSMQVYVPKHKSTVCLWQSGKMQVQARDFMSAAESLDIVKRAIQRSTTQAVQYMRRTLVIRNVSRFDTALKFQKEFQMSVCGGYALVRTSGVVIIASEDPRHDFEHIVFPKIKEMSISRTARRAV